MRVFLFLALLLVATPAHAARWAVGDSSLPEIDTLAGQVDAAITKAANRAPAFKKGPEIRLLVTCTEGGCSPTVTSSQLLLPEQRDEVIAWAKRWILPVTTPGLAVAVRVWWDKPRKGEKKEKLKAGDVPTRPPPGLYWAVGFEPEGTGGLPLAEVLRAERLVFSSSAQVCTEELSKLRVGHGSTTLWHLDITATGIQATPQDQYIAPVDPKDEKAKAAGGGAAAALGLEAPVEAVAAPIETGGRVVVPRELSELEQCLAFKLATARFKGASEQATSVDRLPVTVIP